MSGLSAGPVIDRRYLHRPTECARVLLTWMRWLQMIPEALVHGALPWVPVDRLRRVLVLRYRPHTKAGANPQPRFVLDRLSPETLELTANADSDEVKEVARRWMTGVDTADPSEGKLEPKL
jgi:hypothetical protein